MRHLLLDTHVVLWAFSDPARLSAAVRDAIADPHNVVAAQQVLSHRVSCNQAARLGQYSAQTDTA